LLDEFGEGFGLLICEEDAVEFAPVGAIALKEQGTFRVGNFNAKAGLERPAQD
jgi:hypothetical protein